MQASLQPRAHMQAAQAALVHAGHCCPPSPLLAALCPAFLFPHQPRHAIGLRLPKSLALPHPHPARWNMVLYLQHEKPATGGAGGAMRDATNTSSSAAAPSRAPKHGVSARGGGGGGGSGSGAAVSATANWVVRLAVEARPAMAVRGQTAVAFSGSLAARASPGSITAGRTGSTPSSQALAAGGGASGEGVVQPSGRQMRTPGGSQGRSSGLNLAAAAGGGAGSSGAAAGGAAEALAADQEVDAGGSGGGISWLERPLPQASHVKGRQCDHGYRDFFGVVLNARKGWEAGAWAGFVQPDGKLVLRCRVESVR